MYKESCYQDIIIDDNCINCSAWELLCQMLCQSGTFFYRSVTTMSFFQTSRKDLIKAASGQHTFSYK